MQKRLVSSLSGALSKLPSLGKAFPEEQDQPENTTLVPSVEVRDREEHTDWWFMCWYRPPAHNSLPLLQRPYSVNPR